jgi:aquaporin Z
MSIICKGLVEFIGTLFLVLAVGAGVKLDPLAGAMAVGLTLTALVYMGGPLSGAHYNPAVSLAMLLRGVIGPLTFTVYLAAQLLGGLLGALTARAITGVPFFVAPAPQAPPFAPLLAEGLWTFLLVLVILSVATLDKAKGNSYFGAAIGLTVLAGALLLGPVSGACFNPAVAAGPALVAMAREGASVPSLWVLIVGPCVGAVGAALAFSLVKRAGS